MLNQSNIDAICAANYLENYLECVECLPGELQSHISKIRSLDAQYCGKILFFLCLPRYRVELNVAQKFVIFLRRHEQIERTKARIFANISSTNE